MNETGFLTVAVTHSKGLYPVKSAVVTVFDQNGMFINNFVTDESGKTEAIILPAPNFSLSQTAQNAGGSAAYYTVKIEAADFLEKVINGAAVYSGVNSLLGVDLTYDFSSNATNETTNILPKGGV